MKDEQTWSDAIKNVLDSQVVKVALIILSVIVTVSLVSTGKFWWSLIPVAVILFAAREYLTSLEEIEFGGMYINLLNPISGTLLIILIISLFYGIPMVFHNDFRGFFWLVIAAWICSGFDVPESASPTRVYLLTIFGQKTTIRVYGLTLLLPGIVGKVEFKLEQTNAVFTFKDILVKKKGDNGKLMPEGYLEATLTTSFVPNDRPSRGKSAGQNLWDFDNAQAVDGIKKQLADLPLGWLKDLAAKGAESVDAFDMIWLESNSLIVSTALQKCIEGTESQLILQTDEGKTLTIGRKVNQHEDDLRNFGARFDKFLITFKPSSKKVIDARNLVAEEEAQRLSHKQDAKTMEELVEGRLRRKYGKQHKVTPQEWERAREELVQEHIMNAGKATVFMNKGGKGAIPIVSAGDLGKEEGGDE